MMLSLISFCILIWLGNFNIFYLVLIIVSWISPLEIEASFTFLTGVSKKQEDRVLQRSCLLGCGLWVKQPGRGEILGSLKIMSHLFVNLRKMGFLCIYLNFLNRK